MTKILAQDASLATADYWSIVLPVVLGLLAVYLLLPRVRRYPPLLGAAAGALALLSAGRFLIRGGAFDPETVLFYAFSAVAVVAGVMLVTQRNPVHAALSFALVVLSTCGLFLLQAAPFLMAATVIVYAGAIVVTFLFVIMLAQQEGPSDADYRSREPFFSTLASFVLLGALLYLLRQTYAHDDRELADLVARAREAAQQKSVQEIADALDDKEFFKSFTRTLQDIHGSPQAREAALDASRYEELWIDARQHRDPKAMREVLERLGDMGDEVHNSYAKLKLQPHGNAITSDFSVPPVTLAPGENV
ncbi:MAG TPA: NADH-quinone oxidoreductase subunit J, partial [Gemmataceae bacterium]|nr:NADH-quinone oxidoreductase subunit J [Gemmataceae bacterium]